MRSFLACVVAAALVLAANADCDGCIDGVCYKKHILPEASSGTPGTIDILTNTLYVTDYPSQDSIKKCDLNTLICYSYKAPNTRQLAIDQNRGFVYSNNYWDKRIYRYDFFNLKRFTVASNVETWDIQFRNKLYYSDTSGGIFKYEDGNAEIVQGTSGYVVSSFVIDTYNNIYLTIHTGQPFMRRLTGGVLHNDEFLDTIAFVTLDRDGYAIFTNNTYPNTPGIAATHLYKKKNYQLVEFGAINDWPYGKPLFDRDNNLVYTTSTIEPYIHLKKGTRECSIENNRIIPKIE